MRPPLLLLWLAAPRSLIDLAVSWRTGERYTHVGLVVGDVVVEQTRAGARRLALAEYPAGYDLATVRGLAPGWEERLAAVRPRVGGYDRLAIVGHALGLEVQDPSRWTCSELAWWLVTGRVYQATPGEVARRLAGEIVRVVR